MCLDGITCLELVAMKASVQQIREKYAFTERLACRLLPVPVSSYRYMPLRQDNSLHEHLAALAREKPRFGGLFTLIAITSLSRMHTGN
jgi:hypothetical protein